MKLAIIGSRTCPPIEIEKLLKYIPDTIISGGARGADTYARIFAHRHGLRLIEYLPSVVITGGILRCQKVKSQKSKVNFRYFSLLPYHKTGVNYAISRPDSLKSKIDRYQ